MPLSSENAQVRRTVEPGSAPDALAAFRAAERLAGHLAAPVLLVALMRALLVETLVRLGETERAEQALAELGPRLDALSDVTHSSRTRGYGRLGHGPVHGPARQIIPAW